ncbi:MAG: hypothetical protein VW715_16505 [Rhodospirillales bacterium]
MKNLTAYVEQQNSWNSIFGQAPMTMPLSQSSVESIARSIDSGLSPENLHCDGEISAREAQTKYNRYMRVLNELRSYAQQNSMTVPEMWCA